MLNKVHHMAARTERHGQGNLKTDRFIRIKVPQGQEPVRAEKQVQGSNCEYRQKKDPQPLCVARSLSPSKCSSKVADHEYQNYYC